MLCRSLAAFPYECYVTTLISVSVFVKRAGSPDAQSPKERTEGTSYVVVHILVVLF